MNERVRIVEFGAAYWQRAEEMAALVQGSDQPQLLAAVRSNRGRRAVKRFVSRMPAGGGPLSVDDVDTVCKRFALWTVRLKLDWGRHEAPRLDGANMLGHALTSGIYDLDVHLRRQVEHLLLQRRQDPPAAHHLRALVEARAGETAAAIDVSHVSDMTCDHWDEVRESFDAICNDLDGLLTLAGSPSAHADR